VGGSTVTCALLISRGWGYRNGSGRGWLQDFIDPRCLRETGNSLNIHRHINAKLYFAFIIMLYHMYMEFEYPLSAKPLLPIPPSSVYSRDSPKAHRTREQPALTVSCAPISLMPGSNVGLTSTKSIATNEPVSCTHSAI
jgi:hypothetical protein